MFLHKHVILIANQAGMTAETSRIFFKYHQFDLETPLRVNFVLKLDHSMVHDLENQCFSLTSFFDDQFPSPYCRNGPYGQYGPLWFSPKS